MENTEAKKEKKKGITEKIEVPEKVEVRIENGTFFVKGPKGETSKILSSPRVQIKKEGNSIIIHSEKESKRDKTMVYSFVSHIKNLFLGVQELYIYKLRVCSSHFPIKAAVSGKDFVISNFLGERKARKTPLYPEVKVTVDGNTIIVEGVNKEKVSQQAANIERICFIKNRDRRVFQDGAYIFEKAGKSIM
ncbi:MAG: 50S ribosomal protein L6 [Candidatus Woesearchaeota archaeon]|nr:50S ribosomal protein L6 [Candidatus Woesearchaeota archaeon]